MIAAAKNEAQHSFDAGGGTAGSSAGEVGEAVAVDGVFSTFLGGLQNTLLLKSVLKNFQL
jgi:hypothetical protein